MYLKGGGCKVIEFGNCLKDVFGWNYSFCRLGYLVVYFLFSNGWLSI